MDTPHLDNTAGWDRFWFAHESSATLALFRIAFGAMATLWILSLQPNLYAFFASDGIRPNPDTRDPGSWSLLLLLDSHAAVVTLFAVSVVASLSLTLGFRTRLAAALMFIGIVSFERWNPLIMNSGDDALRNLAFFCMLAPSGRAVSLDRLRRGSGKFWTFPSFQPWPLRLIQLQVSMAYYSAVLHKVHGNTWRNGTAVYYVLHLDSLHRFTVFNWVANSLIITGALTYGALVIEFLLAGLVWIRAARPWVLGLGALLHLSIDYCLNVGFFSWVMLVAYVAFIPPESAERFILALRTHAHRWLRGTVPV